MLKPCHALVPIMPCLYCWLIGKAALVQPHCFLVPALTAGTTGSASMGHHDNHPLPQQPAAAQYSHPVMAGPPTGMKFTGLRLKCHSFSEVVRVYVTYTYAYTATVICVYCWNWM